MKYKTSDFLEDCKRLKPIIESSPMICYSIEAEDCCLILADSSERLITIKIYLSSRKAVVHLKHTQPRYYKHCTWEQLQEMINNPYRFAKRLTDL